MASLRVLFVDDEESILDVVPGMLQYLGYEVTRRNSPIDALGLFQVRSDDFDLVITDQTMPHMTGENLAKELLKIRPEIHYPVHRIQ